MVWLIILLSTLAIEFVTYSLLTIWFSLGAVFAYISYLMGISLYWQIGIFISVSLISLFTIKPLAYKYLMKSPEKTNVYALIGKEAIVTTDIIPREFKGEVKIEGKYWSAVSTYGEDIEAGSIVTVDNIKGVKLFVYKEEE